MRYWVYGSDWGKRISYLLVMSLLLPLLVMALPAKHAMAQVARQPQVAVLDFGVQSSIKASGILGRNATDAVVIEMTRTGRYDVTPRATVNQQLADLGLTTPLDNVGIQKLGQNLGADFIATGDIVDVKFTDNPRRARVTLSVRLTDVNSGELANGAIETGISPAPAPGFQADDEKLLSDAIQNASFNVVRTITSYQLPTATILQVRDASEVILNRGGQDGITQGLEMVVFRGNDRVGRIKVNTVRSTDSTANITDVGKGIRPEDKARAVFQLPGYVVDANGQIQQTPIKNIESYKPRKKSNKSILNVILGLAAAVIIATLVFDKKPRTNSSGLSVLRARAYSDPSDITSGDSSGRVLITWEPAADIPQPNVIEYHIYRDGQIIGFTNQANTQYIDSPALAGQQLTYNQIQFGGGIIEPGNTTTTATTGTTGTTTTTGTTGTNTTGGQTSGNTQGNTVDQPTQLRTVVATLSGLQVGVPHRYSVTVLFRQVRAAGQSNTGTTTAGTGGQIAGGGGQISGASSTGGTTAGNTGGTANTTGNVFYQETPLRRESGTATPLGRPVVTGPAGDQNIARVSVRFNTVLQGNSYVVEFATSPTFSDKKVIPLRNGTAQPFYQNGTGLAASPVEFDLTREAQFSSLPGRSRIFYRVGVRNLSDEPGPLPARERGVPNGDEYIYSAGEQFFTKLDAPPPAP